MPRDTLSYGVIFFLACTATLGGAALINYTVDPAAIFHEGVERDIARRLLAGQNIANYRGYDERLIQKYYIEGRDRPEEVVVLGSSRVLRINRSFFPGKAFFNHGVVHAGLQDFLAMTELLEMRGIRPSITILGLDPSLLNAFSDRGEWKALQHEYERMAADLGLVAPKGQPLGWDTGLERDRQLISWAYLMESLRMWRAGHSITDYYSTPEEIGKTAIKLADGSRNYDEKNRRLSRDEIRTKAIADGTRRPVDGLERFTQLDSKLTTVFEHFVDSLQKKGERVVFFLPPYHPETYRLITSSGKYDVLAKEEAYFREFAAQRHIEVIGSYNPAAIPCFDHEFYDGAHSADPCVAKIFKALRR